MLRFLSKPLRTQFARKSPLRYGWHHQFESRVRMFTRPYIAGIDGDAAVKKNVPLADVLGKFGNNTGNIMFSESLYRNIKGAVRGTFSFSKEDLDGCDAIVLGAANWMNPHSDFSDLAARIEATGLPCIIVGIGAQSNVAKTIPVIHPGMMRLIKYAADSSNMISTRGGFSSRVLNHYGISNCLATGCPSLLLSGASTHVRPSPSSVSSDEVVIHSTRHLWSPADAFQASLYRVAISEGYDILLQSELADMYYALGRTNNPEILAKASPVLENVYGQPIESIAKYLVSSGKVPMPFDQWINYLKTKKFSFGTRLHGTIASLLAGTPAVLITHDSRTVETAEAMSIPTIPASDIGERLDINNLLSRASFAAFESGYERYRQNFKAFFHLNGIETSSYFDR